MQDQKDPERGALVYRGLMNEYPLSKHGKRSRSNVYSFKFECKLYGVNLNVRSEWTESCTVDAKASDSKSLSEFAWTHQLARSKMNPSLRNSFSNGPLRNDEEILKSQLRFEDHSRRGIIWYFFSLDPTRQSPCSTCLYPKLRRFVKRLFLVQPSLDDEDFFPLATVLPRVSRGQ